MFIHNKSCANYPQTSTKIKNLFSENYLFAFAALYETTSTTLSYLFSFRWLLLKIIIPKQLILGKNHTFYHNHFCKINLIF